MYSGCDFVGNGKDGREGGKVQIGRYNWKGERRGGD